MLDNSAMAFSRIVIIYNPNSTGPSQAMAERLARAVEGLAPVELRQTERAGHAEELAAAAARQYDRPVIISSSGDGGYHEVINGVMAATESGYPAVAAVLPAGNANDHRRTVARAPLSDSLKAGRISRLDLLRLSFRAPNGQETVRYAHSYFGLGLTPVIAAELNRHTLNTFRELLIIIQTFTKFRPVAIRRDSQELRVDSLIISNIPHMAKALTLSQTGRPTDGKFEVTTFPTGSKLRLLGRLLRAAVSGLRAQEQLTSFSFEINKPTPVQLDGEVTTLKPKTMVTVTIAPKVLETIL